MKLAISNIAWRQDESESVVRLLQKYNVEGVEIAPGEITTYPLDITETIALRYREYWEKNGIAIVAMQALLFGGLDLQLFASHELRKNMGRYLCKIIEVGGWLGAKALVFGSPKNRLRGQMPLEEATRIAITFFREMGDVALKAGTKIVIEHNPAAYNADFILDSQEAATLVREVGHEGFGLHLDSAGLQMNAEDPKVIGTYGKMIRHFHISEPFLEAVGVDEKCPHAAYANELRNCAYDNWVSIEMKKQAPQCKSNLQAIETAILFAQSVYC